jgi:hypothetical protein
MGNSSTVRISDEYGRKKALVDKVKRVNRTEKKINNLLGEIF